MKSLVLISPKLMTPLFGVITSIADFKKGIGTVLGIIMVLAFVAGVCLIIAGAMKKEDNPAGAKQSMIVGAIIAGAPAIMGILFMIFGNSGAAVDANYN